MFRSLHENLILKIIALVTSIIMWLYVTQERSPNPTISRHITAEVKPTGKPPADLIVNVRPVRIDVVVNGPRSQVESLNPNDVKARVNLSLARPGMTQLSIQDFDPPASARDVTFKDWQPTSVPVELTPRLRKRLPIMAYFKNDAPPGLRYGTPKIDPGFANVSGAKADLDRAEKLVVFVDSQGGAVRADLPIKAVDRDGVLVDNVDVNPDTAHVELGLIEAPSTRTLVVSVPHTGRAAYPYEITDIQVVPDQVTVTGKAAQLMQLTSVSTTPLLLDGIKSDVIREVALDLPPGVSVRGGQRTVRVTVKVRDTTKPGL